MAVAGVVTQTSESWAQPIRQVLIYTEVNTECGQSTQLGTYVQRTPIRARARITNTVQKRPENSHPFFHSPLKLKAHTL